MNYGTSIAQQHAEMRQMRQAGGDYASQAIQSTASEIDSQLERARDAVSQLCETFDMLEKRLNPVTLPAAPVEAPKLSGATDGEPGMSQYGSVIRQLAKTTERVTGDIRCLMNRLAL